MHMNCSNTEKQKFIGKNRNLLGNERALLALPIRLGGLGIADPRTISDFEFAASERVIHLPWWD